MAGGSIGLMVVVCSVSLLWDGVRPLYMAFWDVSP